MKQFEDIQTAIKAQGDDGLFEAKYSDLIKIALKMPEQGGFSYEDIDHRIKINRALDKNPISLEDADHKYLVNLIKRTRWNFWHEDLLKFRDDICQ
jgi:hypothetical protein